MHGYLRHLANFARVVEAGSMKAASDLLGIAPSGLSESIRILESRLGSPLLVRHRTGVTPTSEGERVYASAAGIIDLLNKAIGPGDAEPLGGPCRLSIPTEVANTSLGTALAALRAAHPALEITVFAEDEIVDPSRFGRDYFLRIGKAPDPYPGLRRLWSGRASAILVASAGVIAAEDVEKVAVVSKLSAISGVARKPPVRFQLGDPKGKIDFANSICASQPSTQLMLAQQGLGVTGCLDFCAAAAIRSGLLRQVLPSRFSVPLDVSLLTPHQRQRRLDGAVIEALASMLTL